LLQSTEENKTKALTDYYIGDIYFQDELYRQSLDYYKKSLKYYIHLKDKASQARVYLEISDMYNQLDYPFDSVMNYSRLSLHLSKESGDSINYYSTLSRQGELYYDRDPKRSKIYLLQGYRFLPARRPSLAAFLSLVYSKLNQPDSARHYLQISLADSLKSKSGELIYLAGAYVTRGEVKQNLAFKYLEKAYLRRDFDFKKNIHSQLYQIDKQYDLNRKENENARLVLANRNKIIYIGILFVVFLVVVIILLLLYILIKKYLIVREHMAHELKIKQTMNEQKQTMLIANLQTKIENTLRFNHLKQGMPKQKEIENFIEVITSKSLMTMKEWNYYINEVNLIFEKRISDLKYKNPKLTQSDLIVIILMCLKVDIFKCSNLLNTTKDTIYIRRKKIKKRLGLNPEVDLDVWIEQNIVN
jgi:hypothetical protein